MKASRLLIGLLILACLIIIPVSATYSESWDTGTPFIDSTFSFSNNTGYARIYFYHVSPTRGPFEYIVWDGVPSGSFTLNQNVLNSTVSHLDGYQANQVYSFATNTYWMINETPHTLTCDFNITPTSGFPNQPFICTDTSYGTTGYIVSWLWEVIEPDVNAYNYNTQNMGFVGVKTGNYTINLKVTDNLGLSAWKNGTTVRIFTGGETVYTNVTYKVIVPDGWPVSDVIITTTLPDSSILTGTGTNIDGEETFMHVPHWTGYTVHTVVSKNDYYSGEATFEIPNQANWNKTLYIQAITGGNGTVVPTPTPLPNTSAYALVLSPNSISYGGNVTATIQSISDPTLSNIQQEWYVYRDQGTDAVNNIDFYESDTAQNALNYLLVGASWMGWNYNDFSFSNNKGATFPNPVTLRFTGSGGTKTVDCTITLKTGQQYTLSGAVIVGQGSNYITTHIQAIEGTGGGLIYGPEIDIKNINTGLWKNGTYSLGAADISTLPGTILSVYGSRSGYINAQLLNIPARDDITYELPFYSGVTSSAGNQSLYFRVTNPSGVAISGALVKVTKSGTATTYSGTTSTGGSYVFTLNTSTLYTYIVSKSGYQSASGSFTTTTNPSDQWVVALTVGVNPTATIPTTVPSGVPTPIVTNATTGNYTGFWKPFYQGLTGMGASNSELGLLMTMFFVIFGLIGGAVVSNGNPRATSGCASAMFIISCAFGWIYFWIILAGICWLLASFFLFRES